MHRATNIKQCIASYCVLILIFFFSFCFFSVAFGSCKHHIFTYFKIVYIWNEYTVHTCALFIRCLKFEYRYLKRYTILWRGGQCFKTLWLLLMFLSATLTIFAYHICNFFLLLLFMQILFSLSHLVTSKKVRVVAFFVVHFFYFCSRASKCIKSVVQHKSISAHISNTNLNKKCNSNNNNCTRVSNNWNWNETNTQEKCDIPIYVDFWCAFGEVKKREGLNLSARNHRLFIWSTFF